MKVYANKYPSLALTGPRQSGKTTLLRSQFADYRYVSLENPDDRKYATKDPNGFLTEYDKYVILDEVQLVPELFSYLQTKMDNDGIMGQYILSGSQNFQLMERITQSLAGRIALFRLLPFDFKEMKSAALLANDSSQAIINGFYPGVYDKGLSQKVFYANYINTYLEKDVSQLINLKDASKFKQFLGLCAASAGQLLNVSKLAQKCGVSSPTATSWLSILETSFIVFFIQPYHKNYNKRLVKSPKIYFYDTGLVAHLLRIRKADQLKNQSLRGALFENLIVAEQMKQNAHEYKHDDYWFWNNYDGKEVDLIVESDSGVHICEIKATSTVLPKLYDGLNYFKAVSEEDDFTEHLVYAGDQKQARTLGTVWPWDDFEIV
jgi:predicted AAA+ superfamily ATPase|tara:strand:+ start:66 stop:1196 length:1131 start_codon:yes stop_codon:yes gene_type:complete